MNKCLANCCWWARVTILLDWDYLLIFFHFSTRRKCCEIWIGNEARNLKKGTHESPVNLFDSKTLILAFLDDMHVRENM